MDAQPPANPPGAPLPAQFTIHRRGAYGAVVAALLMATLAEVVGIHLLLSRWSPLAAWVATTLGLYGGVWIVADYRSVRRRPLEVGPDGVTLRRGLLWRAFVPAEQVRAVRRPTSAERSGTAEGGVDLSIALPGMPWVVLEFAEPVAVRGPAGITRSVETLRVGVDDPDGFREAVRHMMTTKAGGTPPANDDGP